jgi:hypothetical protein
MDSSQPPRKLFEAIIMVSAKLFARNKVSLIDNNCIVLSEFMRSMMVLHQEAPSDSLQSVIKDPTAKLATRLKKWLGFVDVVLFGMCFFLSFYHYIVEFLKTCMLFAKICICLAGVGCWKLVPK